MRAPLLLAALLLACAPPPPQLPGRRTALFEFHVGKWVNLHQRLYQASGRGGEGDSDDPDWKAAVDHYRTTFDHRDPLALLHDEALVALNRKLSELGDGPLVGIDPALAEQLQRAAAAYQRIWPDDQKEDRAWIAALEPLIARHGDALVAELERLYQSRWPPDPIRVDVSVRAGPVGAYTVLDPPHITITSHLGSYQGAAALEMLFHEASHALVEPLANRISSECARQKKHEPPQLWHAVLFYATGEVIRRRLDAGYVPYAEKNGLWQRGLADLSGPIHEQWPWYLDGKIDFDTAVVRLVEALR